MPPRPRDIFERFMEKVYTEPNTGCWLWGGSFYPNQYGFLGISKRHVYAHRLSYELFVAEIPEGFHIDHLCKTKWCVNPAHLEAVTPLENTRRYLNDCLPVTHCKRGHEYTSDNTYMQYTKQGKPNRVCRTCKLAFQQKVRDEKRGKERVS